MNAPPGAKLAHLSGSQVIQIASGDCQPQKISSDKFDIRRKKKSMDSADSYDLN